MEMSEYFLLNGKIGLYDFEKFRAMLREKRREKNVRSKGKRTFSLFRTN